mgnify:CR=1 FL=1
MKKNNLIYIFSISLLLLTSIFFLILAKSFEEKQIINLYNKVLKIEKNKLLYEIEIKKNDKLLVKPLNLFENFKQISTSNHKQFASQEFIILRINLDKCKMENISFVINYVTNPQGKKKRLNFSRFVKIQTNKLIDGNFIMFPVYHTKKDDDEGYFEGLLINNNEINCIDSMFKLNNIDDLDLKSFSFFGLQSPAFFKNHNISIEKVSLFDQSSAKDITINDIIYSKTKLKNEKPWKFHFRDYRNCKINNCEYINECVKGRNSAIKNYTPETACSIDSDLIIFELDNLYKKNKIILEGQLVTGKIKINLFDENNFFENEIINKKGKFFQIFQIPIDGNFKLTFSNNISLYDYSEINFIINKLIVVN